MTATTVDTLDSVTAWNALFQGASYAPAETNNERRHRMREAATARHAMLVNATARDRNMDRATRLAEGVTGREGYVAWTFERMEQIRHALNGSTVRLTLERLAANKRGNRVTVTGVATVLVLDPKGDHTEVVAIKGEATVVDIADASTLDWAQVDVKLTRAENRKGEVTTTFHGVSVGLASTGQRIGVKVRCQAGRFARVVASAL